MKNVKSGILYIVGTPIGNLKDITFRAIETLNDVDIILAEDTRQTLKLLNHYNISKKLIAYHKFNENEKLEYIKRLLDEGNNIALVSDAGMPCISDPGKVLVDYLIENEYEIVVIPGVTAFVTGIVKSTLDTNSFIFNGFLPINKRERRDVLKQNSEEEKTVIFYEAPHKLLNTLKDIYEVFGDRKICIARELTKLHEEYKYINISEAIIFYETESPKGEIVLIIEGKSKEEKLEQEKEFYGDKSNREIVKEFMEKGVSKKEAIKKTAKLKNLDKNEIYKECLDI